ncbi:TRAP transporter large permease [Okibacterium endophyticum]
MIDRATVAPLAPHSEGPRARIASAGVVVLSLAVVATIGAVLFAPIPLLAVGGLGVLLLLLLLAIGVPIGFAMIIAASVGLWRIGGTTAVWSSMESLTYSGVATWSMNVVPLFILMGMAMWRSGASARAYDTAVKWFHKVPGGLAVASNYAGAALATSSGSTFGITFALGRMSLPEMFRHGYSATLATGSVAVAGTLGQMIPPSILMVVYAGVAQVSVGQQLLAGVVPGAILAVGFSGVIILWALWRPSAAPRLDISFTWRERFMSLGGALPIAVLALIVIGGMFVGVFTPSEAAAVGAIAALALGWVTLGKGKRGLRSTGRYIKEVAIETVRSFAGLFIILVGALFFTRFITLSGIAQELTEYLLALQADRVALLLMLIVVYIFLGMFLESLPMILLTVPLLAAPLDAIGVDMIWFGVFLVIMCEIGMVFPPIGMLTFVVHRLAQDRTVNLGARVTLPDVFKGVMPFVAFVLVITLAIILWPDIVLWLPSLSNVS